MQATARPYQGPADLRAMQDLASSLWPRATRWHVGDLAWSRFPRAASDAWPTLLWETAAGLRAWGWIPESGVLELAVDPEIRDLAPAVLDWFEGTCGAGSVVVLDSETHLARALSARRYRVASDVPFSVHVARRLENLPAAAMPAGYRARHVDGARDLSRRADVHRAAWQELPFADGTRRVQSRMTEARYRDLIEVWPYRADLDWVVEAPDGELAASCCAWYDERTGVGELEPVGTHPRYRRLGLARAVCLHALHALRALGAREAIVYPRGDAAYPVPGRLYAQLGFEPYARTLTFARDRG